MFMKRSVLAQCLLLAAATSLMTGCSTWKKVVGEKADYKQSRSEPSLEVPPDLSSETIEDGLKVPDGGSTTYSEYAAGDAAGDGGRPAAGQSGVLTQPKDMRVVRSGDKRWLVVQAPAEAVWPKVRDFWLQEGFLLTVDDPSIGILETDWAENRADIPQDFIRGTIGKALDFLYAAATRDRFRVRLERAPEDGVTEIFISHRGMEEVVQGTPDNDSGTIWKPRPSDPELEAEMLRRLMVYMGSDESEAKTQLAQKPTAKQARAQLTQSPQGETSLLIEEGFSRAWREVGLALDRVGFTVEDRDRSGGLYYVRYNDPLKEDKKKGFFSRLTFWSDDDPKDNQQYRILLTAEGEQTRVTVLNHSGARDNSSTARRILTLVQEQMD